MTHPTPDSELLPPCKFCEGKVLYSCHPEKPEIYTECEQCLAWWPYTPSPVSAEDVRAAFDWQRDMDIIRMTIEGYNLNGFHDHILDRIKRLSTLLQRAGGGI